MIRFHMVLAAILAVSAILFVSCALTTNSDESAFITNTESPIRTDFDNSAIPSPKNTENNDNSQMTQPPIRGISKLPILDENIPVGFADVYELLYKDINNITEDSGVIFLGRVVDYRERIYTVPPSADMLAVAESDWMIVDVVEGIVLEADEVLLGEMPEPDSRITLGTNTFQESLDGKVRSRFMQREITLFRDGIESMGSADSPQYLVYAVPSNPGGRGASFGLYWINTRSGVLRVGDDGSLTGAAGMPFVEMWLRDNEGNFGWHLPYDLQDARDAAQLAIQGIEDTSGVPEEQSTGIEEEPVDQTTDSSEQGDDALGGESGDVQGADDDPGTSDDSEVPAPGTAGKVSEQDNTGEASSPEPDSSNVDDSSSGDSEDLSEVGDNDDVPEQGDDPESGESGDAQESGDGVPERGDDAGNGQLGGAQDSGDGSVVPDDGEVPEPGVGGDVPEQGAPVEDAKPDSDAGDGQADDKDSVVPEEDIEASEQTESDKDAASGSDDDHGDLDDSDNGDNAEDSQDAQESSGLGS